MQKGPGNSTSDTYTTDVVPSVSGWLSKIMTGELSKKLTTNNHTYTTDVVPSVALKDIIIYFLLKYPYNSVSTNPFWPRTAEED